ncbi:MAG: hypothetical protein V2A72_07895 [Candidatus Omnitrophota bacterium]
MLKKKTIIVVFLLSAVCVLAFLCLTGKIPCPLKPKPAQETKQQQEKSGALITPPKNVMPILLDISEGYGHIVEGYKAVENPEKVVIHIQDIHTNYEAQKNASKIIEGLIKDKGLKLIMVEGGWGDVSLTYLRSYADKERRLEVAEEYLKEGKISGEEYLNIISDYDMEIQGIEEEALYRQNLDTFFKIEEFREKGTETANQLQAAADALKLKIYPAALIELEKKHAEYEDEEITLSEFYTHLEKQAKAIRLDASGYGNFNQFNALARLEEKIDFAQVETERAKLIEKLSKLLSKEKLTPLVTKSLEFRLNKVSPAEYHNYLTEAAKEANIDMKDYKSLIQYVEYVTSHEEINTNTLFKEADLLENSLKEALAKTDEQKKLLVISRVLKILENFLNLKLIPDDFTYYKERKNDFLISASMPFLKEMADKYNIKESLSADISILDSNLATLVDFYDIANKRDEIFLQKTIALMTEKGQSIAVLIAGGFHTPNLTKMFKEQGISYVIVAPKTTEETDPELYRYILEYKSGKTDN